MKKVLDRFLLMILMIVVCLALIILFGYLAEKLILPEDYLFYENSPLFSAVIAPLMVIPAILIAYFIMYAIKKKAFSVDDDFLSVVWFVKKLGKWNVVIVLLWIVAVYLSFTSLTYVTNDQIVVVTPLNPKGQAFSYADVEKIETGFGDKAFTLYEHEKVGSFYYKLTVDGREVVFHVPSVNSDIERYEDSYLELEELDIALQKYNIPKESSPEGYENCDFDQVYVDRFLRIIISE